jgi:RND family efflux transporter MFP subunit
MLSLLAVCTVVLINISAPLSAHEGHDHETTPAAFNGSFAARGESSSDTLELVAIAQGGELVIYLDQFPTNEPVEGATIEVETPAGPVSAQARVGNAYRLSASWLARPGRYDLIVTATTQNGAEVLPLALEIPEPRGDSGLLGTSGKDPQHQTRLLVGAVAVGFVLGATAIALLGRRRRRFASTMLLLALTVLGVGPAVAHEGEDHTGNESKHTPVRDVSQRLPDGTVFMPKPTQHLLAIRTALTTPGQFRRTIELPGRVIPDPNASGYVQASAGGRLSPPPGGFPKLGAQVSGGDVLAYVTAPLQAIDVSDMRQRQGELDQQISIVERRVARYEPLAQSGAMTRVQLDEARLELQGLKDRRAALDRVRHEPEALIAPVSGIIADGVVAAGQMVQPNTVIFQIVDPTRLWIEALSFEALPGARTATARTAAGRNLSLSFQGSGFADRNQSVPIHFAIESDRASGLRVGQFLTVLASTDEERTGLAVPRSSIVRSANGQDVAYEHVMAERFQPRSVRIEPLDGDRVLIVAGIGPGKRIVTQGAELLDQVR